jgi:hypothetical protein
LGQNDRSGPQLATIPKAAATNAPRRTSRFTPR